MKFPWQHEPTPSELAAEEAIAQAVHEVLSKRDAMLEEMCVQMLLEGKRGLRVVEYADKITAELTDDVPYGEIHWHQDLYSPALLHTQILFEPKS